MKKIFMSTNYVFFIACFLQTTNFIHKTPTDTKRWLSSFCGAPYVYQRRLRCSICISLRACWRRLIRQQWLRKLLDSIRLPVELPRRSRLPQTKRKVMHCMLMERCCWSSGFTISNEGLAKRNKYKYKKKQYNCSVFVSPELIRFQVVSRSLDFSCAHPFVREERKRGGGWRQIKKVL